MLQLVVKTEARSGLLRCVKRASDAKPSLLATLTAYALLKQGKHRAQMREHGKWVAKLSGGAFSEGPHLHEWLLLHIYRGDACWTASLQHSNFHAGGCGCHLAATSRLDICFNVPCLSALAVLPSTRTRHMSFDGLVSLSKPILMCKMCKHLLKWLCV